MTDAEVDAHLYALGIGSDARGTDVMILGTDTPEYTSQCFHARLTAFGARVRWEHESVTDPELLVDYFLAFPQDNALYDPHALAGKVLRPGGRYMVLIEDVADAERGVEITDVRLVGDGEIRAIGWKRRITGDMEGSDEPM